jgi:outer membrane protein OmpA-like peptidoglycan-associated protein
VGLDVLRTINGQIRDFEIELRLKVFMGFEEDNMIRTSGTETSPAILAIALLFGMPAIASPQSHDPKNPTHLGPGVNKGNVDNKENGPNYYYFYAGPGHIELHYAFKAMGVFGNPLKEALSFDLYDENSKLIVHNAVVSVENMEKVSQPGDLGSRQKLILRVISPDTALRLGGYYEIEATGAVAFEGKATGANAKPVDTALYHPAGPLATPVKGNEAVSLYTPQGSLYTPGGSLYIPGASLYTPVGALTNVLESPQDLRLTLAADILFDFDKSTIRADAQAALDRVAEIIRSKSQGVVRIEGFTDSKGAPDYNLRLSKARAESVQNWLADREGLNGAGFSTQGFGATRFAASNAKPDGSDDPAGRQKNRRVEIIIRKRE